jgi:hypothetical protein
VLRRVAALVFIAAAATTSCADDGNPSKPAADARAQQLAALAAEAELAPAARDVLVRAARGAAATYTVSYLLVGEGGGTVEIAQDPPRRRIDVQLGTVAEAVITDATSTIECALGRGGWMCAPRDDASPLASFADQQLEAVLAVIREARDSYDFRASTREIAGARAHCLITEPRPGATPPEGLGGKGTMCVSDEGVVLLVETPRTSLRAERYRTSVSNDAFERPDTTRD